MFLAEELARLNAEIAQKKVVFETQEISQEDVKNMQKESMNVQRSVTQLEGEIERVDKDIWADEMSLGKRRDKIEATCAAFNSLGALLQIIPIDAPNSSGVKYELHATPSASENHKFSSEIKVFR